MRWERTTESRRGSTRLGRGAASKAPPAPGPTPPQALPIARPCTSDRPTAPPPTTTQAQKAFTLIELLVVIAILTLLMALLFPALQRAKKQAQAAVCQAKLRQLGLIFSLYSNENNGRAPSARTDIWRLLLRTKDAEYPELALCPSATRRSPGRPFQRGDTFHAYPDLMGRSDLLGSYGYNYWIFQRWVDLDGKMVPARINGKPFYWGTCHVKQAGNIPVFSDCCGPNVSPSHWESPPESEGAMSNACPLMWAVAINRHNGGTNMLFLDWSLRKVGIKEHWTFKWSRQFDTAGVWTKAGGVLPEDWPKWMRGFRDY